MMDKANGESRRILIVEDDQVVAISTGNLLRSLGYEVVGIADTGRDAVESAQATRPDLILMDIRLRGAIDGMTAARLIQRAFEVPIVFVTGFDADDVRQRSRDVGACGYLTKPYCPQDLQRVIAAVLQQKEGILSNL